MTRLIDANELMEWVKSWQKMDHYYLPYEKRNDIPISELEDIIERMPTVEAVPVEYIRALITELDDSIMKYVGRFDYSASVDSWIHRRGALEGLIKAAELEGLIEEED